MISRRRLASRNRCRRRFGRYTWPREWLRSPLAVRPRPSPRIRRSFTPAPVSIAAGAAGACLLRYELDPGDGAPSGDGVRSERKLEASLALDDPDGYLLRCDKVELPPGGIAYTHTHQGGGIRCLLKGGFNVRVHGEVTVLGEYDAWFEAGPDAVYAWAPDDAPGHFSRVMILPRRLKGKSSIRYVDPEDADKPKLQQYTIFLDEFIET